jgi:hypothetical protein
MLLVSLAGARGDDHEEEVDADVVDARAVDAPIDAAATGRVLVSWAFHREASGIRS